MAVQITELGDIETISNFLDAVPHIYLILNSDRRIVFGNKALKQYLGTDDLVAYNSKLPGELLNCRHAFENETGCGTTESCATCGAFKSIIAGLHGEINSNECRIDQRDNSGALDLRIFATPLVIDGENYVIILMTDISNEKRKQILERIFFHDIMNTAGGLRGFSEMLKFYPEDATQFKDLIYNLTEKLIDEINSQRILTNAENNELIPDFSAIDSLDYLKSMVDTFILFQFAHDRSFIIDPKSINIGFASDPTLLRRVILNLIKNAAEATPKLKPITLSCFQTGDSVTFTVHNPTVMTQEVKLQVFQRSFSTKGVGRGLGTYSIKLLTERYLGGKVSFTSNEETGTTFIAEFPIENTTNRYV